MPHVQSWEVMFCNHFDLHLMVRGEGNRSTIFEVGSLDGHDGCLCCRLKEVIADLQDDGWLFESGQAEALDRDFFAFLDLLEVFSEECDEAAFAAGGNGNS